MKRVRYKMPRPRKYDYSKDYPDTLFISVPIELKNKVKEVLTKKELNDLITKFLSNYVENIRK